MPSAQKWLVFLCFFLYTASYIGRYSYNANINPIMADYSVTKSEAGFAPSCFFFAYGAGQVVHGLFVKFYPRKYVLSVCLGLSAAINLAIFFGIPLAAINYLWLCNGFLLATLWPSLLWTISRNVDQKYLNKAILAMSATVCVGTFIVYGVSAVFSTMGCYKWTFFFGAVLMLVAAGVWLFRFDALTDETKCLETTKKEEPSARSKTPLAVQTVVMLAILAILAVGVNLVKDGLHTWVPTILKENFGMSDSLSMVLTLILPVIGVFGATISLWIRKFIKNLVAALGVLFEGCLLAVIGIVFAVDLTVWIPLMLLFCVVIVLMHAINNTITSIAPLYMRDEINSGLSAGVLNGSCYVGSTISSYGLGVLAERSGWNVVFYLFIGVCAFSVLLSFFYTLLAKGKKKW